MPRISTYGQTLDSQLEQFRAAGFSSRNIYREKVTGADVERDLIRTRTAEGRSRAKARGNIWAAPFL